MAAGGTTSGFPPNNGQVVQSGAKRILCVADVRGWCIRCRHLGLEVLTQASGNLKSLNDLAAQARADFIIHTGDFGFYDEDSLKRIADKYELR